MDIVRPLAFALVLMVAAAPTFAQQRVYQWKDAQGVTHYTDMPPSQAHKTRDINHRSGTASETSAAKSAESAQCLDARANLMHLQGDQPVGIDTDNDGKADRNLTPEERTAQTTMNEAAVQAYCPSAQ